MQVEEASLTCGNAERDEYLYYLLAQHPGRTLVFVNAISAVRRVAALLKLLSLPAQVNMQAMSCQVGTGPHARDPLSRW